MLTAVNTRQAPEASGHSVHSLVALPTEGWMGKNGRGSTESLHNPDCEIKISTSYTSMSQDSIVGKCVSP